jgi:hypothetical protein
MTVYVDDMNLRADVPNGGRVVRGRWSHLYADSEAELRAFGEKIGLRSEWIQHPGEIGAHFDVTMSMRQRAIKAGARSVTWREAGEHTAQLRRAQKAQEAPGGKQDGQAPKVAAGPGDGRVRHSWATGGRRTRICQREGCRIWAEQRWNPATGRPVVIYRKDGRAIVAEHVPPCGSDLPDSGNTHLERQHLADAADRQAGEAWRAGDLDRAFRLVTDGRVLDPDRWPLWDQREQQISARAKQLDKAAEPERDDAQIQHELEEWSLWNQSVYRRGQTEAVLNARESRGVPRC